MPKTAKVTVGGREYVVSQKVAGVEEKWRKVLRECSVYKNATRLQRVIGEMGHIINEGLDNLQPNRLAILAAAMPQLLAILANSQDEINMLVFDYCPEMQKDYKWIMEHAYSDELTIVFIEVLKLNFPILGVISLIAGSMAPGTSTNLPSTNGDGNGMKEDLALSKSP